MRNARLAVQLTSATCIWPGCNVPVADSQIDHIEGWAAAGGHTFPENGVPLCGFHNRPKECGYTITRTESGRFTVTRPDGRIIEDEHSCRGSPPEP